MDKSEKKMVTLKDIAKETGFSINTVSHALKDKTDISEKTRDFIKATADRLGYIGNSSASFLRSGVSQTIAIIVGDISNPHFSIMVKEIEMRLDKKGYTCVVFNTDEQPEVERKAILTALNKNVDGIIICPAAGGNENIQFLKNQQIPFVLIGRRLPFNNINFVICDDENGGYLATKHLLELGHRKILFLNGTSEISSSTERLMGYRRAFRKFGLIADMAFVREISVSMGRHYDRIKEILRSRDDCTAVLAFSDMIAFEVISVFNSMGKSVPADCSVMGFDNIQSKFMFPVPLSTISSSKTTMASKTVEVLLRHIDDHALECEQIILNTKLVERETTAAVRA